MVSKSDNIYQNQDGINKNIDKSLGSFEIGDNSVNKENQKNDVIDLTLASSGEESINLGDKSLKFIQSLKAIVDIYPVKIQVNGNNFNLFFHKRNPQRFRDMKEFDEKNARWFNERLLFEGVRFESGLLGMNHINSKLTDNQLRRVIIAVERALSYVYGYVDNM